MKVTKMSPATGLPGSLRLGRPDVPLTIILKHYALTVAGTPGPPSLSSLRLEITFRVGDSVLLLQPPVVAGGPRHWRTLVTLHLSYCECQGGCGAATPWTGSQTHLCDRCTHASSAGPLHKFVADNRRIPLLACLFAVVPWATLNENTLTEKSYHKLALLLY